MSEKNEKKTASSKVTVFLDTNKKVIIIFSVVVLVALAAFICCEVALSSSHKKNLIKIDEISYTLTNNSSELNEEDLTARRTAALDSLAAYTKKSGITGIRANMLAADLYYQVNDYENAVLCYEAAAKKNKGSYTNPVNAYNAAVCYEQLGNVEEASKAYKTAAYSKNQVIANHAKFSYGRTLEALGNTDEAVKVYTELADLEKADDWSRLAKTRLISISK